MTKVCSNIDCVFDGKSQSLENFYKSRLGKFGLRAICKDCDRAYHKKHKKEISARTKNYYQKNKTKLDKANKAYCELHKNEMLEYYKKYRSEHKIDRNLKQKQRQESDISFKLSCYIRSRLSTALKNIDKNNSSIEALCCSVQDLKLWLENQFYCNPRTAEAMSWNNYGKKGWHVDHIVPLSRVNLQNPEEFKKVCHWFNLRPLWAEENLSKGSKMIYAY